MKSFLLMAIISLCIHQTASAITYVSIEEAVKKGWLSVVISGREAEEDAVPIEGPEEWGSHSGKCINLKATNVSGRSLSIMIETGRTIHPTDTSVQDMMVTEHLAFTIPAGATQNHLLYAMCTQMTDGGPDSEDGFALGLIADSDLRGMAELVEKYKAQDETGQSAIWVITDDLDLASIDGENQEMVGALRKYASQVTGKTIAPPQPSTTDDTRYNVPLYSGSIEFGYRILQDAKVSLIVYSPDGSEFKSLFAEKAHEPGIYTVRYSLERATMDPGVYTLKMFQNGGFVTFKQFRIE